MGEFGRENALFIETPSPTSRDKEEGTRRHLNKPRPHITESCSYQPDTPKDEKDQRSTAKTGKEHVVLPLI